MYHTYPEHKMKLLLLLLLSSGDLANICSIQQFHDRRCYVTFTKHKEAFRKINLYSPWINQLHRKIFGHKKKRKFFLIATIPKWCWKIIIIYVNVFLHFSRIPEVLKLAIRPLNYLISIFERIRTPEVSRKSKGSSIARIKIPSRQDFPKSPRTFRVKIVRGRWKWG